MADPERGEVWLLDLNPTRGREQSGQRPALVVSVNGFNVSRAGLVIILPITSIRKAVRSHVEVVAPEGGLKIDSFIKCEDIRSLSKERFIGRWGVVSSATMRAVEERLRYLLDL
jgi:mRNA interferase MazF